MVVSIFKVFSNLFQTNGPFLHLRKTSQNLWFSDVLNGFVKGTLQPAITCSKLTTLEQGVEYIQS